jgi:O-antigen ligase
MASQLFSRFPLRPGLSLTLFALLMGVLWFAGGASRADALGQAVVRSAAILALAAAILFGDRPKLSGTGAVAGLLVAAILLSLLQLIPLPPSLWLSLPGRELFAEAARVSGQEQPWRPLALVPSAAANAAASLIVPAATLLLILQTRGRQLQWLPGFVLSLIVGSALVGLLQVSGGGFNNPLINDRPGEVSGTFANRNHFALFLAMGCVLAPVWAFLDSRERGWRAPLALGVVLLFALTILASGSRAGLLLGLISIVLGLVIVRRGMQQALRRAPRWVFPTFIAGILTLLLIFVVISVAADRASSINRVLSLEADQDMRARALPTVLEMIRTYFPFGSGLGGFDPIFRIHEPFDLLRLAYYNRAHNDFLEVALDAGLPGILLLGVALGWWAWASVGAWRSGSGTANAVQKLGSAMLLLIILASILDYPARTPMIMSMIIVAGVWLCGPLETRRRSTLPKSGEQL